jgi:hypothetical protein
MNRWTIGWNLLLWGLGIAALSFAPALLLTVLPPAWGDNLLGTIAILISLSITPLAVIIASAGAILLLVSAVFRGRS